VNAAGNLAAALIAISSLAIARGKLKANSATAALPAVNQRISGSRSKIFIGRRLADTSPVSLNLYLQWWGILNAMIESVLLCAN
jgi:hypothetical protein